jgi:hypothetical protein
MGLFLGGFERGFLVYFFGFLGVLNIIGVMRDVFWGFFELFFKAFLGQMSAKRRGFLTQNHPRPSAYFPPLCRSDKLSDRRAGLFFNPPVIALVFRSA